MESISVIFEDILPNTNRRFFEFLLEANKTGFSLIFQCRIFLIFLFPGSLRPDLIESASILASGKADAIKTHHNDSELVRELRKEVFILCRHKIT